ncbi:hypothetical protein K502DRAFT_95719 [Neoconidiobolus thromboides FSU 785]|nr:hypothetical protein K502DRAFT_95719 [Neoconidiobolus thromboides FSU 785]
MDPLPNNEGLKSHDNNENNNNNTNLNNNNNNDNLSNESINNNNNNNKGDINYASNSKNNFKNLSAENINYDLPSPTSLTSQIQPIKQRVNVQNKAFTVVKQPNELNKESKSINSEKVEEKELSSKREDSDTSSAFFRGYKTMNASEIKLHKELDSRPHTIVGNETQYQIGKRLPINNEYMRYSSYSNNEESNGNTFEFKKDVKEIEKEKEVLQVLQKEKEIKEPHHKEIKEPQEIPFNETSLIDSPIFEVFNPVTTTSTSNNLFEKELTNLYGLFDDNNTNNDNNNEEQYQWKTDLNPQQSSGTFTPEEDLIRFNSLKRLSIKRVKSSRVRTNVRSKGSFRVKTNSIKDDESAKSKEEMEDIFKKENKVDNNKQYSETIDKSIKLNNKQGAEITDKSVEIPKKELKIETNNIQSQPQPQPQQPLQRSLQQQPINSNKLEFPNEEKTSEMIKMEYQLNQLQQQMSLLLSTLGSQQQTTNSGMNSPESNNVNNSPNIMLTQHSDNINTISNTKGKKKKKNAISKYRQIQQKMEDDEWE